jgi:hypothetical protein
MGGEQGFQAPAHSLVTGARPVQKDSAFRRCSH